MEAELKAALAARVGETRCGLWFGDGVQLGVDGDSLVVGVPNGFFREWIRVHFAGNLAEAAEAVTGRRLQLDFRITDEAGPPLGNIVNPDDPDPRPTKPPVPIPAVPSAPERPRTQGRALRRLEDFVTGPGNRLAHVAAIEIVDAAGATFNPLLIHAGVGMGKTHLLEGITAGLRVRHPSLKVILVTAEAFTNHFLESMRAGGLPSFRARYRTAGALIVDDVHFLAAKRATQDEFLHTFNALTATGSPIVLAADQHPRLVPKLTDELVTRFLGGMVVKLEPPDLATRRAILKAKASARRVEVSEAVLAYVAEHLRGSVRELEGALHTLIAHAGLTGRRIDMSLAHAALSDTIRHTAQTIVLKDVVRAVCSLFQIDAELLKSEDRSRAVSYPRMLAMYLARKHTGAAYNEIGRYFGDRNHSTVISAEKKVENWLRDEEQNTLLAGFERISDVLTALERQLSV
jgi:chromosomal replication initiator protein